MIRKGDLLRKKWDFIKEKLTTLQGLFTVFVGGGIWAFAFLKYNTLIYNYISATILSFIKVGFLNTYFSYITFSLVSMFFGLLITTLLIWVYNLIFK